MLQIEPNNLPPIYLFQMGKVGSLSLFSTLGECLRNRIIHGHCFEELPPPDQLELTKSLHFRKRVDVICPVRDPLSRNVSGFFQTFTRDTGFDLSSFDWTVDALSELFLERYRHDESLSWFDLSFKPVFGIDIYDRPFPKGQKWTVYEQGMTRVLIYRTDLERSKQLNVISDFVDQHIESWVVTNQAEDKSYARLYRRFCEEAVLPESYISRMHASSYGQQFWTETEASTNAARWRARSPLNQLPEPTMRSQPKHPDAIVSVQNISKAYRAWEDPPLPTKPAMRESGSQQSSLTSNPRPMLETCAGRVSRDSWALRNISFELRSGESVGIIGHNGSGKSTLLQIISGKSRATSGQLRTTGAVAALFELSSGFKPEITGRENVYLSASSLGLSQRQVEERFDQIAALADLGNFIEQPVETYSKGMCVRLAFAVLTAVELRVLIVDDALSLGDVFFQQCCFEHMREMLNKGGCIILASHDLGSVQQFCKNVLVLKNGSVAFNGSSTEAIRIFLQLEQERKAASFSSTRSMSNTCTPPPALQTAPMSDWPTNGPWLVIDKTQVAGNGWAQCSHILVCNRFGKPCVHFRQGDAVTVFYEFEVLHDMEFCVGGMTLRDKTSRPIFSKVTLQDGIRTPTHAVVGTRLRFRQEATLDVECADYTLDVSLDMIAADLLKAPGITYDQYMTSQLQVYDLRSITTISVRLRDESFPFQLKHFGVSGLPSNSLVQVLPPPETSTYESTGI